MSEPQKHGENHYLYQYNLVCTLEIFLGRAVTAASRAVSSQVPAAAGSLVVAVAKMGVSQDRAQVGTESPVRLRTVQTRGGIGHLEVQKTCREA